MRPTDANGSQKLPGASRRLLRVEKEMRNTIASYLTGMSGGGFRGELKGLVTVSRVSASADLRSAKVFVSVLGTEAEQEATIESLESRARDVQSEVNRQLRMKHCPKLSFELDHGLEKSMHVDAILRSIELGRLARSEREMSQA